MTNSHIPKSTEAKLAPPAVSLCSFSSWFASHVHILHRLDSMFTSAPARATTPTRTGSTPSRCCVFAPVSVRETGAVARDVAMHGGATMRAKGRSRGRSDHGRSESDTPVNLVSSFHTVWLPASRCIGQCLNPVAPFNGFIILHKNKSPLSD